MNIVIVGAGIIGLTSAHALSKAGHAVTVVDRHPAPAQGCSAANGGFLSPSSCAPWAAPGVPSMALRSLFDERAPMRWRPDGTLAQLKWLAAMAAQCGARRFAVNRARMLALARYSHACRETLAQTLEIPHDFQSRGVLRLCDSPSARSMLQRQLDVLRAQGTDAVWLDRDEVMAMEPGLRHGDPPLVGALHVRGEGSGRCESFSTQLAARLARQGVRFLWNTRIDEVLLAARRSSHGDRFEALRSGRQRIEADACVIAAGPEAAPLLAPRIRLPVYPVKGYSMTARILDTDCAPRHAVLDEHSKLAIAPFAGEVRVAGFADVVGHDLSLDAARTKRLAEGFEARYPGVADVAGARFWAGLRPMTPDGTPVIGATDVQGLFLNTGHGTYGWTLSFGSAQLLADLVDGRDAALPAADYALTRGVA